MNIQDIPLKSSDLKTLSVNSRAMILYVGGMIILVKPALTAEDSDQIAD